MKTMHLFAGAGGGILADLILGHEPVVAVEWEPYACQVLRERVADGWFAGMSVWEGDVRLFDPSEYKGRVDCIHAGFPCQDISVAGSQAGVGEGTRSGLYREVLRVADEVRPGYLFLENVAAITSNGLDIVLADLAERGYDAVWKCLSASEVGARHIRDRWWCLAYPDKKRRDLWGDNIKVGHIQGDEERNAEKAQQEGNKWLDRPSSICSVLPDSECKRQQRSGRSVNAMCAETDGDRETGVAVADCGWAIEPNVGRVAYGMANGIHRLSALGNGQVPLQAAAAFSILWQMMEAVNDPNHHS